MHRIKEIEKVFDLPASLSVIHVDGNKGEAGRRFPQKRETARNGLFQGITLKPVSYTHLTLPTICSV